MSSEAMVFSKSKVFLPETLAERLAGLGLAVREGLNY
jgi:hypothetical protein